MSTNWTILIDTDMKNLPPCKTIDIFAHKYRIVVDELHRDELGRCDPTTQKIHIRNALLPDTAKDTLLHEIIHAICFHSELPDPAPEESLVSRIATGLRIVLCQNPDLATWIFSR